MPDAACMAMCPRPDGSFWVCSFDQGHADNHSWADKPTESWGGDPVEVRPADSRAESQSELTDPSGSPTSPPQRASAAERPWCECDPEYEGHCPDPCALDTIGKTDVAATEPWWPEGLPEWIGEHESELDRALRSFGWPDYNVPLPREDTWPGIALRLAQRLREAA